MPTLLSASNLVERRLWTADDFLEWLEPGRHADLIDGEKFMHSPVSLKHANLINFLDRLLGGYVEDHDLGVVYRECVAVRLGSRNVFLPDLLYLDADQAARSAGTFIAFAPRLVVEALSPNTADRDIGPKFAAYEENGVREYWVLDPETHAHRFYAREDDILVEFAQGEDVIHAREIPGFMVRREWLGPDIPKVRDALTALNQGL